MSEALSTLPELPVLNEQVIGEEIDAVPEPRPETEADALLALGAIRLHPNCSRPNGCKYDTGCDQPC